MSPVCFLIMQATYYYQQASFLAMQPNTADKTHEKVLLMYHKVPELKQRIAGKSIPVEKFAVAKSKKFLMNGIDNSLAGLVSGLNIILNVLNSCWVWFYTLRL